MLLLQRAATLLFGPEGSVTYLHTYDEALGSTPAASAKATSALTGVTSRWRRETSRQRFAVARVSEGDRREALSSRDVILLPIHLIELVLFFGVRT